MKFASAGAVLLLLINFVSCQTNTLYFFSRTLQLQTVHFVSFDYPLIRPVLACALNSVESYFILECRNMKIQKTKC